MTRPIVTPGSTYVIDVADMSTRTLRVVVASPITMGYGSPRYMRLYKVLASRGHRVLLMDHEESVAAGRRPYSLNGYRRLLVHRTAGRSLWRQRTRRMWEGLVRRRERPDVLIAGNDALLSESWPSTSTRVIYYGEIESECSGAAESPADSITNAADAVIAPQEDRLELARGIYKQARSCFCVQNAPMLAEHADPGPRALTKGERIHLLYQGQVSRLTCADIMLGFARRNSDRFHLHVAGPVKDGFSEELAAVAETGALTYHGYLRQAELADLRKRCDVGLVTWREGGDLPLSIKYACPNKLYEYIADGLPVVFMPNHSLGRWNTRFGFGAAAADYTVDAMAEALAAMTDDEGVYAAQSAHNTGLFREELNFEHQVRPFVQWLEEGRP